MGPLVGKCQCCLCASLVGLEAHSGVQPLPGGAKCLGRLCCQIFQCITSSWCHLLTISVNYRRRADYCHLKKASLNFFKTSFPDPGDLRREQVDHLVPDQAGPTWDGSVQGCSSNLYSRAKVVPGETLRLLLPRRPSGWVRPCHIFLQRLIFVQWWTKGICEMQYWLPDSLMRQLWPV